MIRAYRDSDYPYLKEMFKSQNFTYDFPEQFDGLNFPVKQVLVDDNDIPRMAIVARQTVELYMLQDKSWMTPAWRLFNLCKIQEETRKRLVEKGYTDAHVFLPPVIKRFGDRLRDILGWTDTKEKWRVMSRFTGA